LGDGRLYDFRAVFRTTRLGVSGVVFGAVSLFAALSLFAACLSASTAPFAMADGIYDTSPPAQSAGASEPPAESSQSPQPSAEGGQGAQSSPDKAQAKAPPTPPRTPPPGMRFDPVRIYIEAGASAAQEREIRLLVRDYELAARVKIVRSKNMLQRLRKMSLEVNPDENTVIALQEEINKLQGDIQLDRIRMMLRLRYVLNEEQRAKLAELMQTRPQAGATAHDAP
jgi:Spy/CpxP family protein refolding chaperone